MRLPHFSQQKEIPHSHYTHDHQLSINIRSRSLASERIKREGTSTTLYEKFMLLQQNKNEHILNSQFKQQEESFQDLRDRPQVHTHKSKKGTSLRDLSAPKCKTIDLSIPLSTNEESFSFCPNIDRLENLVVIHPNDKSIGKDIQRIRKAHEV